jgi:hypothetical protein
MNELLTSKGYSIKKKLATNITSEIKSKIIRKVQKNKTTNKNSEHPKIRTIASFRKLSFQSL